MLTSSPCFNLKTVLQRHMHELQNPKLRRKLKSCRLRQQELEDEPHCGHTSVPWSYNYIIKMKHKWLLLRRLTMWAKYIARYTQSWTKINVRCMIIKDDVSHTHSLPLTLYVITWTTGKLFTNVIKKKEIWVFLKWLPMKKCMYPPMTSKVQWIIQWLKKCSSDPRSLIQQIQCQNYINNRTMLIFSQKKNGWITYYDKILSHIITTQKFLADKKYTYTTTFLFQPPVLHHLNFGRFSNWQRTFNKPLMAYSRKDIFKYTSKFTMIHEHMYMHKEDTLKMIK